MDSLESSELSEKAYTSLVSSAVTESISSVYEVSEEASVECKEEISMENKSVDKTSTIFERRSVKSQIRKSLGKLRPSASLDEYSPPPSASFTIHRPSWVAMEDIEVGATIRRKKKARKSLSREISIEGTVIIQEEPLVYTLSEELDESSNKKLDTNQSSLTDSLEQLESGTLDDTQVVPDQ